MKFWHDHLHFRCEDYKASAAFYLKMFQGEDLGDIEAMGMPISRVKVGDMTLSFSPKRDDVQIGSGGTEPHYGLYQLGIQVHDLEAVVKDFTAKGAEIPSGVVELRPELKVAFMKAPDGVEIELMQRG